MLKKISFYVIFIQCLLFTSYNLAATYYVDATNGNDSNSGVSMSSPWKTINKVNSQKFLPGDFILFKRGETFNSSNGIIVSNSGKLGKPITFSAYGIGTKPIIQSNGYGIQLAYNNYNYITIEYLHFVGNSTHMGILFANTYGIIIQYCEINGFYSGALAGAARNAIVRYNKFDHNYPDHGIYLSGLCDSVIIENNEFAYNEAAGIHFNSDVSGNTVTNCIVRYNTIHNNVGAGIANTALNNSEIYYNVFYNNGGYSLQIDSRTDGSQGGSLVYSNDNKIYNNTFINNATFVNNGSTITPGVELVITHYNARNEVRNNIFFNSISNNQLIGVGVPSDSNNIFSNNLYYHPLYERVFGIGPPKMVYYADWVSYTGDSASINSKNPSFQDPQNLNFKIKSSSPAIKAGTYVGLKRDIDYDPVPAKPRLLGAYQESQDNLNYIDANIKVFLAGPFTNDTMKTSLNSQNLLPLSQPFSKNPWNYNGKESVNNFNSNIVDWILVELRSSTSNSTFVARRAGLLTKDGIVVDTDGISSLRFNNLVSGRLLHCNSTQKSSCYNEFTSVFLSISSPLYDFTSSQSQAYGSNPMISLGNQKFGMYAGDGDSNGGVNADRNNVWRIENGTIGYLQGDYDLSGGANSSDLNSCWRISNGTLSQVPQ